MPNLYGQEAPIGSALEKLVTSLYSGDPEAKRAERQTLLAKRRSDADLQALKVDKLRREAGDAEAAKAARGNAPMNIAEGFYGPVLGKAMMDYHNAGGQVQPQAETADTPGIQGGYAMDLPPGVTQEKMDGLGRILGGLAASQALPGKTNYEQLMKGGGEGQKQDIIGQVIASLRAGGSDLPTAVGAGYSATSGKPVYQDHQGRILNQITGASNESGPTAQAELGKTNAEMGRATAQTGQANATSAHLRADTLPQGVVETSGGVGVPATGKQIAGAAIRTMTGGAGGTGLDTYQDRATGKRYMIDRRKGTAELFNDDGTRTSISMNDVPSNIEKVGASIGMAGGRENVFLGRVGLASGQVTRDLENIVKLPLSASIGVFGTSKPGAGLLDATKAVLANKVTSQEAQSYRVKATGLQRNLAAIEAAGLMPSGALTHQMDQVMWSEGDTQLTKLQKLAQTKQIVDSGIDHVMANPRISADEKQKLSEYRHRLEKSIPFSHEDLDSWAAETERNPDFTLKQFISRRGAVNKQAPAAARAASARPTKIASDAEYEALPPGTQFEAPDGTVRTKP